MISVVLSFLVLGVLLVTCYGKRSEEKPNETVLTNEIKSETAGSKAKVNLAESKEVVATMLNLNGLLCAEVVSVRPLVVKSGEVFEVTCIEYRGGKGEKIYLLDSSSGRAWIP